MPDQLTSITCQVLAKDDDPYQICFVYVCPPQNVAINASQNSTQVSYDKQSM